MLGLKQEALADLLGDDWSQKKVSSIEGKETIESELLDQLATALKVPVDAIKSFSEEAAINIISSTLQNTSVANINQNPVFNFNPIDKMIELYESKIELYERMLKEKNELIEKLLENKK